MSEQTKPKCTCGLRQTAFLGHLAKCPLAPQNTLAPCPFCGELPSDEQDDTYYIFCDNSSCGCSHAMMTEAQWNTRAPCPKEDEGEREKHIETAADIIYRALKQGEIERGFIAAIIRTAIREIKDEGEETEDKLRRLAFESGVSVGKAFAELKEPSSDIEKVQGQMGLQQACDEVAAVIFQHPIHPRIPLAATRASTSVYIQHIVEQFTQPIIDFAEWGWTIIANASGGDWTKESEEWQMAAAKYRDDFHERIRHYLPSLPERVSSP